MPGWHPWDGRRKSPCPKACGPPISGSWRTRSAEGSLKQEIGLQQASVPAGIGAVELSCQAETPFFEIGDDLIRQRLPFIERGVGAFGINPGEGRQQRGS